jgi:hypothetical protein
MYSSLVVLKYIDCLNLYCGWAGRRAAGVDEVPAPDLCGARASERGGLRLISLNATLPRHASRELTITFLGFLHNCINTILVSFSQCEKRRFRGYSLLSIIHHPGLSKPHAFTQQESGIDDQDAVSSS